MRFSEDVENADKKAFHSAGLAALLPGDGSTSERAKPAGSGDKRDVREGGAPTELSTAGCKEPSDISAADTPQHTGHDALDAKRHGTLPSWQRHLRMPVVEW